MSKFNFADAFEEAEEAGYGPSDDLAVGKYTATIVSANAGESQNGDEKLGFLFKAAEGSESGDGEDVGGDTIWLNLTFSENGAKYAAADAKRLGLTAAMLNSDAEAAVETVVGQEWKITVVLSKDKKWTNVRLNKRLDGGDDEDAPKPKSKKAKAKAEPKPKKGKGKGKGKSKAAKADDDDDDDGDPWEL